MKSIDKTCYSDSELTEFKEILLGKRRDAENAVSELMGSVTTNEEHGGVAETAAENAGKETSLSLVARQKKYIGEIDNALKRIENKTYGICRQSKTLIPKERLLAMPTATMCIPAKVQVQPQTILATTSVAA